MSGPVTDHRLTTLRGLVDRSNEYIALSIAPALIAGLLATAVSLLFTSRPDLAQRSHFEIVWLTVLAVGLIATTATLARDAARRGERLLNARSLFVLRTISPVILASAAVTAASLLTRMQPFATAGFWMIFYGLALLALASFAPRQILWLGWAFLLSGITLLLILCTQIGLFLAVDFTAAGYWIMGGTFGLYHATYAWLAMRSPADGR